MKRLLNELEYLLCSEPGPSLIPDTASFLEQLSRASMYSTRCGHKQPKEAFSIKLWGILGTSNDSKAEKAARRNIDVF